jgi:hypothetical protein
MDVGYYALAARTMYMLVFILLEHVRTLAPLIHKPHWAALCSADKSVIKPLRHLAC